MGKILGMGDRSPQAHREMGVGSEQGLTCFSHLSELLICLPVLTREEPDHRVLELSSGQHLIQVAASSVDP